METPGKPSLVISISVFADTPRSARSVSPKGTCSGNSGWWSRLPAETYGTAGPRCCCGADLDGVATRRASRRGRCRCGLRACHPILLRMRRSARATSSSSDTSMAQTTSSVTEPSAVIPQFPAAGSVDCHGRIRTLPPRVRRNPPPFSPLPCHKRMGGGIINPCTLPRVADATRPYPGLICSCPFGAAMCRAPRGQSGIGGSVRMRATATAP